MELVLVYNQDKFDLRKELSIWEVLVELVLVYNQDKFDLRKELSIWKVVELVVWVHCNQAKPYLR